MASPEDTQAASPVESPRRRANWIAALIPLAFAAGIGSGYLAWGRTSPPTPTPVAAANPAPPSDPDQPVRLEISLDDDPSLGPADAPITIVEFSDFACGFCQRFHVETFRSLLAAYPDQIHFVYRDFPVVGGFEAAQAANCAAEQGDFWGFHDLLFTGGLGLDERAYRQYAADLGLDGDALMSCVSDGRYAAEVEADAQYVAGLGARGTPTFFINGIPLIGAQPLENFVQVIESELAQ
jgi:protein-disulfide isomerase